MCVYVYRKKAIKVKERIKSYSYKIKINCYKWTQTFFIDIFRASRLAHHSYTPTHTAQAYTQQTQVLQLSHINSV